MNINYDEIITKANQRKEALRAFAAEVDKLPQTLEVIRALATTIERLKTTAQGLDQEAAGLVGYYKVHACINLAANYNAFINSASSKPFAGSSINEGLEALLKP